MPYFAIGNTTSSVFDQEEPGHILFGLETGKALFIQRVSSTWLHSALATSQVSRSCGGLSLCSAPVILMQHRLLPVQLHHNRRSVLGMQRILDLLSHLLRRPQKALQRRSSSTQAHQTRISTPYMAKGRICKQ